MPKNWNSSLINAQVEINRAVWAMNNRSDVEKRHSFETYINTCITEAIRDLTNANELLNQ